MERRKRLRRRILAAILAVCMMITMTPVFSMGTASVEAATTRAVTVQGKAMYSYAYQVLKKINQERKAQGMSALVMDMDLMDAAMQRAAENIVSVASSGSISHTRPNGNECFSVSDKSYAENLACGQRSADVVVSAWMNSTMGHRENILNSRYTCVGIGCIQVKDVMYLYWTQEFGYAASPKTGKQPTNAKKTFTVSVTNDIYKKLKSATGYKSIIQLKAKEGWEKDSTGWRYRLADGSFLKSKWRKISGAWYYFKSDGYMATGWIRLAGKWYYLRKDGTMKTGWLKLSGKWYYLKKDGSMLTGAATIGKKIYRFKNSGVCLNP